MKLGECRHARNKARSQSTQLRLARGEVFYLCRETCRGGLPSFGLTSFLGVYYKDITRYISLCTPPDSPQRYDFAGPTPNDYMDIDLSPIFGLISRFGAVSGGIWRFFAH